MFAQEKARALLPLNRIDRGQYLRYKIAHGPIWTPHGRADGLLRCSFETFWALPGIADQNYSVPLFGHTVLHSGIAGHAESDWVLDAGDAQCQRVERFGEVGDWRRCLGNLVHHSPKAVRLNSARLPSLVDT